LGRELATHRDFSDEMAQQVDAEVKVILETAMDEAHKALTTNRAVLDKLAKELLEKETLNQDEIATIFKAVKKLPKRTTWRSSTKRALSTKGPIAVPERKVKELKKSPTRRTKKTKDAAGTDS
jgi:cell division protease FtsH